MLACEKFGEKKQKKNSEEELRQVIFYSISEECTIDQRRNYIQFFSLRKSSFAHCAKRKNCCAKNAILSQIPSMQNTFRHILACRGASSRSVCFVRT